MLSGDELPSSMDEEDAPSIVSYGASSDTFPLIMDDTNAAEESIGQSGARFFEAEVLDRGDRYLNRYLPKEEAEAELLDQRRPVMTGHSQSLPGTGGLHRKENLSRQHIRKPNRGC